MATRITLAVTLLCGLLAADGTNKTELANRLKEHKIARFFKSIEARDDLDAATKEQILKLREGAILGGEYGCIQQALVILDPDYRKANALLLGERYAAASELFAQLAKRDEEYVKAYATFRYGLSEMNREHFENAAEAFTAVLNEYRYAGCDIESAFYLAVCHGQMRDKEKAIVAAQRFLDDYPDAPERYRNAMEQMKNELVQEWESPLYDLAGRMNGVAREIKGGDTGEKPQGEQKEIVSILDELIKKAEEQEGQGNNGGGGGGPPQGNRQSSSPANQSALPGGGARVGDLRPKPQRKAGEQWGLMRDKEREEVLQALKEKFPDRYRELLEQYNKALAEGKRVTELGEERQDDK